MKRFLTAMITTAALAGCASSQTKMASHDSDASARQPASAKSDVSLSGKKAADMMGLIDKVGAIVPDSSDCGMGTCGEEGRIGIQCKYPNGPNPKHRMNCTVSAVEGGKKSTTVSGLKARQLVGLMETLKATEDDEDPCEMGSCYEQGLLDVTCTFQNGSGGNNRCDVTALKPAASSKFPSCPGDYDHGSCQDWQDCCDKNYKGQNACVPGRCG